MISKTTLSPREMVETGKGMKLLSTMARAVPLPTETWLGSMKKNTEIATMAVPRVMMAKSFTVLRESTGKPLFCMECLSIIHTFCPLVMG